MLNPSLGDADVSAETATDLHPSGFPKRTLSPPSVKSRKYPPVKVDEKHSTTGEEMKEETKSTGQAIKTMIVDGTHVVVAKTAASAQKSAAKVEAAAANARDEFESGEHVPFQP